MFYKIQHNDAPSYLCQSIPPTIQSTTVYILCSVVRILLFLYRCRLSLGNESCITSTRRQWNSLDIAVRNDKSIHRFKTALKRSNSGMIKTLPKYYGPPMRCFASFPSIWSFQSKYCDKVCCQCGANREDSFHFCFECPSYSTTSRILCIISICFLMTSH